MSENGNGKLSRNRRARTVWTSVALVTIAFYVCQLLKSAVEWFSAYAQFMTWAVIAIVAGLSATDAVRDWKCGPPPGGQK